ncbi:MAG: hypothetical protein ACKVW3_14135 [Phycisphaerales bacterium]
MRVTKHSLTTDPRGRTLAYHVEHLADDGRGRTTVVNRTIQARCRGCSRPLLATDSGIGLCDCCGKGFLCSTCQCLCQVCSRRCCRRCRRGFVWGRAPLNTCPGCFRRLNRRAVYEQRVAERQAAFARGVQRHQERLRALAMRLQMLRMGHPGSSNRADRR